MDKKIVVLGNTEAGKAAAALLARRNTVTTTLNPADCAGADFVVVALKTKFNALNKSYETEAVEEALRAVRKAAPLAYIGVQSTVPLGFTQDVRVRLLCDCIFALPALVRPAHEMEDITSPARIVVGAPRYNTELVEAAVAFGNLMAEAADNEPPVICMGPTEAEAVALFSDAYRALRSGFFNELDTYAETKGLHADDIIRAMTLDPEIGTTLSSPNFGIVANSAAQLEQCFTQVPQRGAAPQYLFTAAAKTGRTRRNYVIDRILTKGGYYESDFAGCCKCAGAVVFVGIYDPAALARTEGSTPAIVKQVIKKLIASGEDTTVYIYDPKGEAAAMGLTDGCKVIEELSFFTKNSDVILAPSADLPELDEVAEKVYCRSIAL